VDNDAVVANAGADFTKNCLININGAQIGETPENGFTYSWSSTDGINPAGIGNPTVNPSSTTTYTVTKTNTSSGCSNTDNVTVTVTTNAPDAPTICVVQPSLCGPAKGSVTIKSPLGADYEYSINDGTSWQSNPLFSNLDAGSVTGIKVKRISTGCISSGVLCNASNCSESGARLITTTTTEDQTPLLSNNLKQLNIKAFPNPFSDRVKFVITSSEAGNGSLEVYNMLGQKVKTVFRGYIQSGANAFEVNLPLMRSAQLLYVLRMGDKTVTGKLLQLNR